jgi:hypothetical protein
MNREKWESLLSGGWRVASDFATSKRGKKKAGDWRGGELSNARSFVESRPHYGTDGSPVGGRSNQPGRCQSLAPNLS